MVWTKDFRAGIVGVDPGGGSTETFIRAIKGITSKSEEDVRQEIASGSIFADTVYKAAATPMASFTTEDIDGSALYLPWGTCLTAVTDSGVSLYQQAQDCSGVGATGHAKAQIKLGVMVPRTLSIDHQGNASLAWDVYSRWDGSNDPVVRTASVALPSSTATPVQRYTMEQATVANVAISGKRNISIDFNPTVLRESADSDPYNTVVSVSDFRPRVTIRGVDPSYVTSLGIAGATCLPADTSIELRARGVARNTTSHYKLTFAGLATVETFFDGNNNSPAESNIIITCGNIQAGVNSPISGFAAKVVLT